MRSAGEDYLLILKLRRFALQQTSANVEFIIVHGDENKLIMLQIHTKSYHELNNCDMIVMNLPFCEVSGTALGKCFNFVDHRVGIKAIPNCNVK